MFDSSASSASQQPVQHSPEHEPRQIFSFSIVPVSVLLFSRTQLHRSWQGTQQASGETHRTKLLQVLVGLVVKQAPQCRTINRTCRPSQCKASGKGGTSMAGEQDKQVSEASRVPASASQLHRPYAKTKATDAIASYLRVLQKVSGPSGMCDLAFCLNTSLRTLAPQSRAEDGKSLWSARERQPDYQGGHNSLAPGDLRYGTSPGSAA